MRRVLLAAFPLVLAGCQAGSAAVSSSAPVKPPVNSAPPPVTTSPTAIGLVRKGQAVTVGMRTDDAFKVFRDARDNGFEYDQIPPVLAQNYRGRSWETGDRGFGVITYNDRVVAAMYQESGAKPARVDEFVAVHQERLGNLLPLVVDGRRVRYWFWETEGQRLMICAYQTDKNGIDITTCMGDNVVLDALGAAPRAARIAQAKVDGASAPPKGSAK